MKVKLLAILLGSALLLSIALTSNAAASYYLRNSRSSFYKAYYYSQSNCNGVRRTLYPGQSTTRASSVKTYAPAWYIKWSNGNVTSRLKSGSCVNLPIAATVYA